MTRAGQVRHLYVCPFVLMCEPGEDLASTEQLQVNMKRSASTPPTHLPGPTSVIFPLPLLPSIQPCSPPTCPLVSSNLLLPLPGTPPLHFSLLAHVLFPHLFISAHGHSHRPPAPSQTHTRNEAWVSNVGPAFPSPLDLWCLAYP